MRYFKALRLYGRYGKNRKKLSGGYSISPESFFVYEYIKTAAGRKRCPSQTSDISAAIAEKGEKIEGKI